MIRKAGILLILLFMMGRTQAQDSLRTADAFPSFILHEYSDRGAFVHHLLENNVFFSDTDHPKMRLMQPRDKKTSAVAGRTALFFVVLGVCFLLAIIRQGFQKYFTDLFRAFISPTLSQRQLKDQLYQTPFPAFALNVFFTISAGLYLYLVLLKTRYLPLEKPLYLVAFFILLFMLIYTLKYVALRICGWLLGLHELMDNYIFTLFLINKILGVILLPFILILAFSPTTLSGVFFNISLLFIALLFVYRYIRVFPMIKSQVVFSKFHFFLYLCGFEIAPILIIGKLTLIWLNGA